VKVNVVLPLTHSLISAKRQSSFIKACPHVFWPECRNMHPCLFVQPELCKRRVCHPAATLPWPGRAMTGGQAATIADNDPSAISAAAAALSSAPTRALEPALEATLAANGARSCLLTEHAAAACARLACSAYQRERGGGRSAGAASHDRCPDRPNGRGGHVELQQQPEVCTGGLRRWRPMADSSLQLATADSPATRASE
jgi:hypothetical protein